MSHTEQNKAKSYRLTLADVEKMGQQKHKVLYAFGMHKYLTRRELSAETGIEISSLCRIIKDFQRMNVLRVAFSAECKTTGKMVAVYTQLNYVDSLQFNNDYWRTVVLGATS